MAMSHDLGLTFDDDEPQPLGRQGERSTRVIWTRIGMMQGSRVFRWRTTEPVTVRRARYNESLR
jgi:hypothetical protein